MATLPTHEDTHATEKTVPKPGPGIMAPRPDFLLAMLATDYIIGDKHHYALIRAAALRLLENLGEDGKEAKARIEGMSGAQAPVVVAPTAKAA